MAAGNEFQIAIVTPEALVLEGKAAEVQFPAHDGQVGILNHRAPLLTKLGTGLMTLKSIDGSKQYAISGGYAQMKDNVLTILTDQAIAGDKLQPQQLAELTVKGLAARGRLADAVSDRKKEDAKKAEKKADNL